MAAMTSRRSLGKAAAALCAALLFCLAGEARGSEIQTPPPAALAPLATEEMLHQLALANLIASNCQLPGLSSGDAGLLAGTAQALAAQMGISTEVYFAAYIQPAIVNLAAPDGCSRHAGATRAMVARLETLGGSVLRE